MHISLTIKLNYEGDMRMPKTPAQKMFHSMDDNGNFSEVALPVLLITR